VLFKNVALRVSSTIRKLAKASCNGVMLRWHLENMS
jgi:hypothetical protein